MLNSESTLTSQPPYNMGEPRPSKRRKLAIALPPSHNILPSSKDTRKPVAISTVPSCVSCHRALNTAQGLLIICARCSSPTCAICSRTCTACPTSMPPTPYLTRSPTPSPSPPPSPRRTALALHSANTNWGDPMRPAPTVVASGEKRRKAADEDSTDYSADSWLQSLGEHDLTLGCGRTVCRNCCTENIESASTTCYDCVGRY
ncbi:hypothetical protein D9615_010335 [Tricholomella constricta]|uniref:Uncharacterized protein n=1 Tax=Tricholomella constricta TaxID=117010 RepID=A0A8H5GT71_9AGAR|nr:hypothetical protein D9615_010335 [Tricholomella constricta]